MKLAECGERETISATQAGSILGLSRATIWRLLRDGHLAGYQKTPYAGSPWVVYVDSVKEYLRKREGSQ